MDAKLLKRLLLTVAALAVVAGAAAAVIGLLGSVATGEAAGASVTGTRFDVDQAKSLPLEGKQRIDVEVVSSDVTVTESSDGNAHAHLTGTVSSSRSIDEPQLLAETLGDTASFRVDHRSLNVVMGWYRSDLKLEVAIPKGWRGELVVHGVSADLVLGAGRTFTSLEVATVSGDVDLGAFTAGSFACRTVSGGLRAPGASAKSADLSSTSGGMTVGGLTGDLTARTVSGDFELVWTASPGSVDVSTTSGSVTLGLPVDSGFRLDAASTSGNIASDFPVTVRGSASGAARHSLAGDVGSGTGSIRVRTVSGAIRIGK